MGRSAAPTQNERALAQGQVPVSTAPTSQSARPNPSSLVPNNNFDLAQSVQPLGLEPIQVAPMPQPGVVTETQLAYATPTAGLPNGLWTQSQPGLTGSTKPKVALMLPTSASGGLGKVAKEMRNAALLARDDSAALLDLNFFDTADQRTSLPDTTMRAINSGNRLILGPLLGDRANTVASLAQGYGLNVISFSNDVRQARPGAFLIGFSPERSVETVIAEAAAKGLRRVAILQPRSTFGQRAAAAAQQSAYRYGIQILGSFTYDASSGAEDRGSAAEALADQLDNFDAILIADAAQSAREMAALLLFHQVSPQEKQILGTNLWVDSSLAQEAGLRGAWFAAADETGWKTFAKRYAQRFGNEPAKVAGLAYDAVTLAAQLARQGQAFDGPSLTSQRGFRGLFGSYQLQPNGTVARDLQLRQVGASALVGL